MGRIGDALNYPKSGVWNIADVYRHLRFTVPAPAVVESAALWLDAADLTTITQSGGDVSQWDNKGTLGNFTQATAASQPTTGVSEQNGRNVINFASDHLVAVNANEWRFLHDGTDYLVCSVVQFGTVANPNAFLPLFGNNNASGSNIGAAFALDDRDAAIPSANELISVFVSKGTGALGPILNRTANDFFPVNTFGILSALLDPNNATAANRAEVFANSGSGSKNNTASDAPSTSNPTFALRIGDSGNGLFVLTGKIAEIVIVSGADATESNRVIIRDYLNQKWDVF